MHFILPSGKLTVRYGKWPIEIADLPLKLVIFHSVLHVYQRVKMARLVSLATSWPTYLLDPELSTRHTWARIVFVGHVKKAWFGRHQKHKFVKCNEKMSWNSSRASCQSQSCTESYLWRQLLQLTGSLYICVITSQHWRACNWGIPFPQDYQLSRESDHGPVMVFRFSSSLSGTKMYQSYISTDSTA